MTSVGKDCESGIQLLKGQLHGLHSAYSSIYFSNEYFSTYYISVTVLDANKITMKTTRFLLSRGFLLGATRHINQQLTPEGIHRLWGQRTQTGTQRVPKAGDNK